VRELHQESPRHGEDVVIELPPDHDDHDAQADDHEHSAHGDVPGMDFGHDVPEYR